MSQVTLIFRSKEFEIIEQKLKKICLSIDALVKVLAKVESYPSNDYFIDMTIDEYNNIHLYELEIKENMYNKLREKANLNGSTLEVYILQVLIEM